MFNFQWESLILPVLYLITINASMVSIYTLYQKYKAAKSAAIGPWFPNHLQRDIYHSLMHIEPSSDSKTTVKVPDSLLRAALLRRAVEDIKRLVNLRTRKQACGMLRERRSIGDDLWDQLVRAEAEMELELRDVVSEANALVPGWGQTIFQSANEMVANTHIRADLGNIHAKLNEEKEWWARKSAAV